MVDQRLFLLALGSETRLPLHVQPDPRPKLRQVAHSGDLAGEFVVERPDAPLPDALDIHGEGGRTAPQLLVAEFRRVGHLEVAVVTRFRPDQVLPKLRKEPRGPQLDERVLLLGFPDWLPLGVQPDVIHKDRVRLPGLTLHGGPLRRPLPQLIERPVDVLVRNLRLLGLNVQAQIIPWCNLRPDIDLGFVRQRLSALTGSHRGRVSINQTHSGFRKPGDGSPSPL